MPALSASRSRAPAANDRPKTDLDIASLLNRIRKELAQCVRGKDEVIDLALVALLARGHLLIEDQPGVGKSTLARSLARAIGGEFRRVQFTSDMLPGDLLGVNVWSQRDEKFEFHPGPVFTNVLLADEINRAPPRTQSALLEAMGEGHVSIDGASHVLPQAFTVLATQNPVDHHGTYPLPESQRDRFSLRISMGYPPPDVELELLQRGSAQQVTLEPVAAPTDLLDLQSATSEVFLHADLARYAQQIAQATRRDAQLQAGVSIRGVLAWVACARARALMHGREQVIPEDLQSLVLPALAHRIIVRGVESVAAQAHAEEKIREYIAQIPAP